jgi:hypothetical protein
MIEAQRRIFERRNLVRQPEDIQLLRDIGSLVRSQRQLAGGPLYL